MNKQVYAVKRSMSEHATLNVQMIKKEFFLHQLFFKYFSSVTQKLRSYILHDTYRFNEILN